ncbi:MAG: hypothetical protein J2P43_11245, partial [Candidatus Dormibacteraeota bacterium]|nr:hypothetical protein [Candidatus Dormibacteraeota bacterium]
IVHERLLDEQVSEAYAGVEPVATLPVEEVPAEAAAPAEAQDQEDTPEEVEAPAEAADESETRVEDQAEAEDGESPAGEEKE